MNLIVFLIGCLLVIFCFINRPKNFLSALLYKAFPFFSGLYLIFYSIKVMEWV